MVQPIYLILANGTIFEGKNFGAAGEVTGEVVFTTGMTGYLETLTDPSYYGQIVIHTFPLIGNYGIIPSDFESKSVGAKAYIVKYPCQDPSNFRSEGSLGTFLCDKGIIGLHGIDTRKLTKIIRDNGVMNGKITANKPNLSDISEIEAYSIQNPIAAVSVKTVSTFGDGPLKVALLDFGAKKSIGDNLVIRGCKVWQFPYNATAEEILAINPDGIMLSNGPGDPADFANIPIIETLRHLMKSGVPIFGICMGHLLLAIANGYTTKKLKFGHRGANQPVMDVSTGRVYITSQNHGYTVVTDNASMINVNDKTCEAIDYGKSFSVQFHPEAHCGPQDTGFLFDKFIDKMIKKGMNTYAAG